MKLAIIGAGSSRLPLMLASLAQVSRDLGLAEVSLYDLKPERIEALLPVAQALAARCGTLPRIRTSATPRDAVGGAGVVILTARPGFEQARARDERTCVDLGVIGQETTGPAGFAFAARSIPVAIEYGVLAAAQNPACLVLVFMNPAGMVTQALREAGVEHAVGVCDSAMAVAEQVSRDLPRGRADARVLGLNHLSWTLLIRADGRDLLREVLDDETRLREVSPWFAPEFVRTLGCIPNEYLVYFYRTDEVLRAIASEPLTRGEALVQQNRALFSDLVALRAAGNLDAAVVRYAHYVAARNDTYLEYARTRATCDSTAGIRTAEDAIRSLRDSLGGYAGIAVELLKGLRGTSDRSVVLNVPGCGVIRGLDPDDVVEVDCDVGPAGIRPRPGPSLGPAELELVLRVKEYERLAIRAILERSASLAEQALCAHPLVPSREAARRLVASLPDLRDLGIS